MYRGIATLFAVYYTLKLNIKQNEDNIQSQKEKSRLDIIPYIDVRVFLNKPMGNLTNFIFKDLIEKENEKKKETNAKDEIVQFPSGYIIFNYDKVSYSNNLDEEYKTILEQGGVEQKREGSIITYYSSNIRKVGIAISNVGIFSAIDVTIELDSNLFSKYAIMPSFNLKVDETIDLSFIFDRDFPEGENIFLVKFDDIQGNKYIQSFKIDLKESSNHLERITSPKLISNQQCPNGCTQGWCEGEGN